MLWSLKDTVKLSGGRYLSQLVFQLLAIFLRMPFMRIEIIMINIYYFPHGGCVENAHQKGSLLYY